MSMLSRNNIVGELFRDRKYILIKTGGYTETAIAHGDWVFEREDGKVCFHSDLDHKSKYRPIIKNNELERLRAFVSDVYDIEMGQNVIEIIMGLSRKHGLFPVLKAAA